MARNAKDAAQFGDRIAVFVHTQIKPRVFLDVKDLERGGFFSTLVATRCLSSSGTSISRSGR